MKRFGKYFLYKLDNDEPIVVAPLMLFILLFGVGCIIGTVRFVTYYGLVGILPILSLIIIPWLICLRRSYKQWSRLNPPPANIKDML